MLELGEGLPVYRPPLNMAALFDEPTIGDVSDGNGPRVEGVTVRYLTPHNKWSIHSEYQDNLFMLSLSRDRKSVVSGKSVLVRVDLGGRRIITKHTQINTRH